MKRKQQRMFGCADLPLWSGTAPRGTVEAFVPPHRPPGQQLPLVAAEPEPTVTETTAGFTVALGADVVQVRFDGTRYWCTYRPTPGAYPVRSLGIHDRETAVTWATLRLQEYRTAREVDHA